MAGVNMFFNHQFTAVAQLFPGNRWRRKLIQMPLGVRGLGLDPSKKDGIHGSKCWIAKKEYIYIYLESQRINVCIHFKNIYIYISMIFSFLIL